MSTVSIDNAIKKARECSLLGNYDESIVYYDGAVADITRYLREQSLDPRLVEEWTKVKEAVLQEVAIVNDIIRELASFKERPIGRVSGPSQRGRLSPSPTRFHDTPSPEKDALVWSPPSPRKSAPAKKTPWNRQALGSQKRGSVPVSKVSSYGQAPVKPPVPKFGTAGRSGSSRAQPPSRGRAEQTGSEDEEKKMGGKKESRSHDDIPVERPRFSDGDPEMIAELEQEILDVKLSVKWDSIAGLSDAKTLLKEAVVLPMRYPKFFSGIRRPWKGILMYGPPGTGKTMLARAVATECNTTFFNCSVSSLLSKWHGDSEKKVRTLFRMAHYYAPSTVFFDEIDAIGGTRDSEGQNDATRRMKSQLLTMMDGIDSMTSGEEKREEGGEEKRRVVVIAATNYPWNLDEALKRRLEKRIYIPLPDPEARRTLLHQNMEGMTLAEDVDLDALGDRMEGYSGADITNICRDVAFMGMRKKLREMKDIDFTQVPEEEFNTPITAKDFETALSKVSPSVSKKDVIRYEEWKAQFGAE